MYQTGDQQHMQGRTVKELQEEDGDEVEADDPHNGLHQQHAQGQEL